MCIYGLCIVTVLTPLGVKHEKLKKIKADIWVSAQITKLTEHKLKSFRVTYLGKLRGEWVSHLYMSKGLAPHKKYPRAGSYRKKEWGLSLVIYIRFVFQTKPAINLPCSVKVTYGHKSLFLRNFRCLLLVSSKIRMFIMNGFNVHDVGFPIQ